MSDLSSKQCVPCQGGVSALSGDSLNELTEQVPDWDVVDGHHLTRQITFEDFAGALDFVNRVGAVAEEQNHHPNISFTWGKVDIDIWTHKIDGLTESDFILAAKISDLNS